MNNTAQLPTEQDLNHARDTDAKGNNSRPRARARTRESDAAAKSPRCAAALRDGSPCTNIAIDGDLCPSHARKREADRAAPEEAPPDEPTLEPSEVIRRVADLRTALAEDTNNAYGKLWGVLEAALDASKSMKAPCDHCGKWTRVPVPDMNARVKAAQLLIEYTAGKPATAPTKPPAVTKQDVSKLTDEELEAIVASERVAAGSDSAAIDRSG